MRLPRRWKRSTRRAIWRSRICCEILGCENAKPIGRAAKASCLRHGEEIA